MLSIQDPQKTIDNLIYISNKFGLIFEEDLYYWNINSGRLKISQSKNYLIPFIYKKTIITLGQIKIK